MLQIVQEIVGYFQHMDELDNLEGLESENVEIDSLDLIGLGEVVIWFYALLLLWNHTTLLASKCLFPSFFKVVLFYVCFPSILLQLNIIIVKHFHYLSFYKII